MFERPGLLPSEDPVENAGVDHPSVKAEVVVEGRTDVSDGIQLFPHPRVLQHICVLRHMEPWEVASGEKYLSMAVHHSLTTTQLGRKHQAFFQEDRRWRCLKTHFSPYCLVNVWPFKLEQSQWDCADLTCCLFLASELFYVLIFTSIFTVFAPQVLSLVLSLHPQDSAVNTLSSPPGNSRQHSSTREQYSHLRQWDLIISIVLHTQNY